MVVRLLPLEQKYRKELEYTLFNRKLELLPDNIDVVEIFDSFLSYIHTVTDSSSGCQMEVSREVIMRCLFQMPVAYVQITSP